MKKIFVKAFLAVLLFTGLATASNAQRFCISMRPAAPVIARPAYHSAGSVWIAGDYRWGGASAGYVWHPGYYARPPKTKSNMDRRTLGKRKKRLLLDTGTLEILNRNHTPKSPKGDFRKSVVM